MTKLSALNYYKRILNAYVFNKGASNLSFWHTPLAANAFSDDDRNGVRLYPMNFFEKTKYDKHHDAHGTIMLDYGGELGVQYNPNAIAQAALGHYDAWLAAKTKNDAAASQYHRTGFLKQADWFMRHGRAVNDDIILWEYEFPFEFRETLENPWRSALAQGQAISTLIRAALLTGDEKYLQRAHKGFNSFRYSGWEHGGGVIYREKGLVWLEEAVLSKPNHILNGWIWALWGVRDYAVHVKDDYATRLYEESGKTLKSMLDRYDLGFWTCYDDKTQLKGPVMPVSPYYQRLHIVQMKAMYELTHDDLYLRWHDRWLSYYNNSIYKMAATTWKIYFKLRHW